MYFKIRYKIGHRVKSYIVFSKFSIRIPRKVSIYLTAKYKMDVVNHNIINTKDYVLR